MPADDACMGTRAIGNPVRVPLHSTYCDAIHVWMNGQTHARAHEFCPRSRVTSLSVGSAGGEDTAGGVDTAGGEDAAAGEDASRPSGRGLGEVTGGDDTGETPFTAVKCLKRIKPVTMGSHSRRCVACAG